jgi:hypothetical protein
MDANEQLAHRTDVSIVLRLVGEAVPVKAAAPVKDGVRADGRCYASAGTSSVGSAASVASVRNHLLQPPARVQMVLVEDGRQAVAVP